MKKLKYRRDYQNEPMMNISVRVQPANAPAFEAKMKAGISQTYLLKPGVCVCRSNMIWRKNNRLYWTTRIGRFWSVIHNP